MKSCSDSIHLLKQRSVLLRSCKRFVALYFVFSATFASGANPAPSPEVARCLKELDSKLASVQTLKVNFVEEKEMSILEQKLVLKGRITLQKPDKIAWRVQSPIRYAMVIDRATLRQWSDDTQAVQQFSLTGNPIFATAIKQIQSWFSGNYLVLTSDFDVVLAAKSPLVLQFTPHADSPARDMIVRIVMRFGSDERFLDSLEVDETGGDKMRIAFSSAQLNPPLGKAEWDVKSQ